MSTAATILALDLGTATGWAIRVPGGQIVSGTQSFKPGRHDGIGAVYFEEMRRHAGVDAADGEPPVDSRNLAGPIGVAHRHLFRLLLTHQADFEELGIARFENALSGKRGMPQRYAMLNEDQAYLLLAYAKNTPEADIADLGLLRFELAPVKTAGALGHAPADDSEAGAAAACEVQGLQGAMP